MSYEGNELVDISEKTSAFGFRINSKYLTNALNHLNCEEVIILVAPDGSRVSLKCPDNDNQQYAIALLNA